MRTVISFSCPVHLALRIDAENIPRRKFSAFVCDAIMSKLDGQENIAQMSSRRLMALLLSRDDVDPHLKEEILRRLNLEH